MIHPQTTSYAIFENMPELIKALLLAIFKHHYDILNPLHKLRQILMICLKGEDDATVKLKAYLS